MGKYFKNQKFRKIQTFFICIKPSKKEKAAWKIVRKNKTLFCYGESRTESKNDWSNQKSAVYEKKLFKNRFKNWW